MAARLWIFWFLVFVVNLSPGSHQDPFLVSVFFLGVHTERVQLCVHLACLWAQFGLLPHDLRGSPVQGSVGAEAEISSLWDFQRS